MLRLLPESLKAKLRRRAGAITLADRLANLRAAGFSPRKIIDAGAYRGEWALLAAAVFPAASILLVEPQPHLAAALAELCRTRPKFRFRSALLGAEPGTACFVSEESNSRIIPADYRPLAAESVTTLPIVRLADLAPAEGFGDCDFLKLDLQGHELTALAGAGPLFGTAEVILAETSWLRIGPVPLVHEVIAAFTARGYRLYDVFGFNYRPLDRALWQTDFLFVHADSPLLASTSWA